MGHNFYIHYIIKAMSNTISLCISEALSKLASFLHIAKTISNITLESMPIARTWYMPYRVAQSLRSHRFIYCATCYSCQNNANKINTLRHNIPTITANSLLPPYFSL